jgi:predicted short-subunit dehydrogenase-like oxidoreductase (DUF2520 family)
MTSVRIIGPGRAGTSLALALTNVGWEVAPMLGRHDDLSDAATGVKVLVIATPDDVIGDVADRVRPVTTTVVAHMSGSLGLRELAGHERRAAFHPLVALPTPEIGAKRLIGAWYAVAGDDMADKVVAALGGRAFVVDDDHRATYHAAAAIASNHLVALMGQVERLAADVDVPFEAYLDLARASLANVAELGPQRALTGPAARGDEATIRRHLRALPTDERKAYRGLADAARRLARRAEEEGTAPSPRGQDATPAPGGDAATPTDTEPEVDAEPADADDDATPHGAGPVDADGTPRDADAEAEAAADAEPADADAEAADDGADAEPAERS